MTPQNVLDKLKTVPKKEKNDEDAEKWPKQAALYVYREGTKYNCGDCYFLFQGKCSPYGPSVPISLSKGSCGLFLMAQPERIDKWINLTNKLETGYMESEEGFSCKRCEYFGFKICSKVDENSPGDTPGIIDSGACCNRWSALD